MTDILIKWNAVQECPFCGGEEKHWFTQVYWSDLAIPFWLCECGLVYAGMTPADEGEVKKYYEHFYTPLTEGQWGIDGLKENELGRATRVAEGFAYPEIKRHLDIGCGYGVLMEEISNKYGCLSEGCDVRNLTENYKVYGSFSEIEDTYDLVTCVHTLEHSIDPLGFLKEMRPLCSKHLYIEVPSLGTARGTLSPHHLFGFTAHSLKKMVEAAGFPIVLIRQITHSNYEDEEGITRGKVELQCFAEVGDE